MPNKTKNLQEITALVRQMFVSCIPSSDHEIDEHIRQMHAKLIKEP